VDVEREAVEDGERLLAANERLGDALELDDRLRVRVAIGGGALLLLGGLLGGLGRRGAGLAVLRRHLDLDGRGLGCGVEIAVALGPA
jgi:hypothetical protein